VTEDETKGNGQKQLKQITIKYTRSKDYKLVPANGCFGGVTPRGEIQLEFFQEHVPAPDIVVHDVTEQGTLGPEKVRHTEGELVRELQIAVVLQPNQAENIARWLLGKVEGFKKNVRTEGKQNESA
jgi:hypothetical protein